MFNKDCIKGFENIHMGEYGEFIFNECVKINAQEILEIGVNIGVSTRILLEACRITGGHLTSVDIDDRYKMAVQDKNWTFVNANSALVLFDKAINVLLIDSSHFYIQTLVELTKFTPLVKEQGIVFLHDIGYKGVYKAVIDFMIDNNQWSLRIIKSNSPVKYQALGIMMRTK